MIRANRENREWENEAWDKQADKVGESREQAQEDPIQKRENGQTDITGKNGNHIELISIIGEAEIEESGETEGVLVLINTVGGDVSCGLALAEMIASLSKPTVSLVIGDSHSIGVPLAVAVDHSFIVPTGTMMVHPVRMTGMVIGAVQTYDYFEMIQDRILSFVSGHSQISYERLRSLMLNTEMMTKDLGTVLVGGEAVQEGLIDECGGIREALAWLNRAIDGKKQEIDAHDRMTKTEFSENLKRK